MGRSKRKPSGSETNQYADDADEAAGEANDNISNENESDNATSSNDSNALVESKEPASNRLSLPKTSSSQPLHRQKSLRPSLQRSASSFNQSMRDLQQNLSRQSSRSIRALKRQSSVIVEGINENLPASPSGWALLTLATASVGLQYELKVQSQLTAPPIVFCQNSNRSVLNERMDRIYDKLSRAGDDGNGEGVFSRRVTPSLFIGTRGVVSSTAAYVLGDKNSNCKHVERVREVMKMGADGALIVLDWEIPLDGSKDELSQRRSANYVTKAKSIDKPVVLLLHGLNNDSSFGYIRSMMRTATERGWIAVCMNFRGQDGEHKVKNTTPRPYNAGYTGDLRGVVQQIEHRLKRREVAPQNELVENDVDYVGGPIFVLGYSLGANIVTKYLGEESLHGTLPQCIGGGAAMGNPLHVHAGSIRFPWNVILGAGVKRSLLHNFHSVRGHHDPGFQSSLLKALLSPTLGRLDDAAAPYLVRNDPHPPYTQRIGFRDGEDYWNDSSSHRHVAHVSVPLLKISAQDDFLVFGSFSKKLNHCLENPNVIVVKTRCGGHLGWQESPPPPPRNNSGGKGAGGGVGGRSWSDAAVADFIEALLQVREEDRQMMGKKYAGGRVSNDAQGPPPLPKLLSKL